ncbi:MAG: hypothetical protein V2I33_10025 [Kangiellaceae bacterium]|nr:hypothetical protein [Kangiellaceae bacterium]
MNIKSLVLACTALTFGMTQAADLKDLNSIKKDLRIMTRIIETSLGDERRFGNRVESKYLANQGFMFTIHSSASFRVPGFEGDWEAWGESISANALEMVGSLAPMVSEVSPEAAAEMEEGIAESLAELAERENENNSRLQEELARMRENMRENRDEYRDALRELRDLERDRYRADEKERAKIEAEKEKVEKKIAKEQAKMAQYKEKMDLYRAERKKRTEAKKQSLVSDTLVTICDYSASLKSLKNNEHVTLVFDDFGGQRSDLVYVFKKSDLASCDSDKAGIKNLMDKAITYQL